MTAKPKKPHLADIFAAFGGIGYAAMGVLNTPSGSLAHPLCVLEEQSSNLRYKLRQDILDNMTASDQEPRQGKAAGQALDFLRAARAALKDHGSVQLIGAAADMKGGFVTDVIADIDDLLTREMQGEGRPLVSSNGGGELLPRTKRDYFPAIAKDVSEGEIAEKVSSKQSASDDQKNKQAKGGRGGRKSAAEIKTVFAASQIETDGETLPPVSTKASAPRPEMQPL